MIPTELFRVWRLVERLPNWVTTPDVFYSFDDETQILLLHYEVIREAEEMETVTLMAGLNLAKKAATGRR